MTTTVVPVRSDRSQALSNSALSHAGPSHRRRHSLRRAIAIGMLTAAIAAGCTVTESKQYQVDYVFWGYHFHIYRIPTMFIWLHHQNACNWNPACTLEFVRRQADMNGIISFLSGADRFFDNDVDDFNEALRSTPHPWPLSVNVPEQYGCLGGYRNTGNLWNDGDWYGDPPDKPWCKLGSI